MDIKTFVKVVSNLPPEISVLVKGPTGIGKSHIFHQIGKEIGLEVLDRRLSYMTEGDLIGLPELVDGTTRFAPVNWFIEACNEPRVLFFDELNRATLEVQQCAFQIVLDRELNGHKLHPETRVYAAVNEGSDYQVTEMDPALLRRFWSIDLEPTTDDWLEWAETVGNIDPLTIGFIKKYPARLRHTGTFEPGIVYPNPASWARFDKALKHANLDPSTHCGEEYDSLIFSIGLGFIGEAGTVAFSDYVKNHQSKFSAKDLLNRYHDDKGGVKSRIDKLTNDKKNDLLSITITYLKTNDVTVTQAKTASSFIDSCSDEMLVNFMNMLMETKHLDNIKKFHKFLGGKVVKVVNAANDI